MQSTQISSPNTTQSYEYWSHFSSYDLELSGKTNFVHGDKVFSFYKIYEDKEGYKISIIKKLLMQPNLIRTN